MRKQKRRENGQKQKQRMTRHLGEKNAEPSRSLHTDLSFYLEGDWKTFVDSQQRKPITFYWLMSSL